MDTWGLGLYLRQGFIPYSYWVFPKGASILRAQGRGVLFSLEGRKPQIESPTQMLIQAKCKLVIELWPCKSIFPRAREFKIPYNFCKLILISKEPVKWITKVAIRKGFGSGWSFMWSQIIRRLLAELELNYNISLILKHTRYHILISQKLWYILDNGVLWLRSPGSHWDMVC